MKNKCNLFIMFLFVIVNSIIVFAEDVTLDSYYKVAQQNVDVHLPTKKGGEHLPKISARFIDVSTYTRLYTVISKYKYNSV